MPTDDTIIQIPVDEKTSLLSAANSTEVALREKEVEI